jgi:hypothetical protein
MSPSPDLETILSKHKVLKGQDFSHTSMGFPAGSFYIPHDKTAEFHDLYHKHINGKKEANLTEKHKHICPILIDLDFRYMKDAADAKRVYTAEQVKDFTTAYMRVLSEYVDLTHDPTFSKSQALKSTIKIPLL